MASKQKNKILEIKNLTIKLPKRADRKLAVENVSLDIFQNEILCIVGESGSGKSIMSSAIMRDVPDALEVSSGEIIFKGKDILKMTTKEINSLRGDKISMIGQEPMAALNPSIKVGRQVDEVFELHQSNLNSKQRKLETLKLFEQMGLPKPERIYNSYPHQISGGQSQRVVIAMALACKPDILIADEPTTALDVTTQAEILKLFNDLRNLYDNAVIFITHDFGVVADIADRVAVMCWGRVVEEGKKNEILMKPQDPYTKLLVDAMPSLEALRKPKSKRSQEALITVANLHKIYGKNDNQVHAVNDVSFALKAGETLGIVGESGSGKSTLAKSIIRLVEPSSGAVTLNEEDFLNLTGNELVKARKNIQMVFQDPFGSLNPTQTVEYMITRGMMLQGIDRSTARQKTLELLEKVGLSSAALKRKPRNFSGGQRQRIGIARALSLGPDVIIADESVSALDLSVQKQVLILLNQLQKQFKMAIIFITHDLRVAAQISDYIAVMEHGKVVEMGRVFEVFNNPKDNYTKKLLNSAPGKNWHPPRLMPSEAKKIAKLVSRE